MNKVSIDLKHCYGIKSLNTILDFTNERAYAIYAPNGAMKSSLAETFSALRKGNAPSDRIFPERKTICKVTDENGAPLKPESIFVICPYDAEFSPGDKVSLLLVDQGLKKQYEALHKGIDEAKEALLKAIKKQSGSKREFESEISSVFTATASEFKNALYRIRKEVGDLKDTPLKDVNYDLVFDERVVSFMETNPVAKTAIAGYVSAL